jgi:hypothetical protein
MEDGAGGIPKFEARNPKQFSKAKSSKFETTQAAPFEAFPHFVFRNCFEIRASDFEFLSEICGQREMCAI